MKTLGFGRPLALGLSACALALGCAVPPAGEDSLDPEVAKLVLDEVPRDLENPTLVDFGGKVHLVGYELSPTRAAPRSTLTLKLYFRSIARIGKGWKLFTHLEGTGKDEKFSFDDVGVLREKLPPGEWLPGNVYIDEQVITVPSDVTARELLLTVGFEHDPLSLRGSEVEGLSKYRLEILSGVSDGSEGAVIARLPTGVSGRKAKPSRRRGDRPGGDRRLRLDPKILDQARQGGAARPGPGSGKPDE